MGPEAHWHVGMQPLPRNITSERAMLRQYTTCDRHLGWMVRARPMFATICRFAVWFALLLPDVWPGSPAVAASTAGLYHPRHAAVAQFSVGADGVERGRLPRVSG
jgi:hypothetical protein